MNPIAAFLSLLANSRAGQDLTPLARAFLRQLEGVAVSAVFAGIVAVSPFLNGQTIDWANVLHVFLIAFGTSFGLAVTKYFKAQGDAPQNPAPATAAPAVAQSPALIEKQPMQAGAHA